MQNDPFSAAVIFACSTSWLFLVDGIRNIAHERKIIRLIGCIQLPYVDEATLQLLGLDLEDLTERQAAGINAFVPCSSYALALLRVSPASASDRSFH